MKTRYLLHKASLLLFRHALEWSGCTSWKSGNGKPQGSVEGPVWLDLSNPEVTHLGDQLFFEPLARSLSRKVDLVLSPTPGMEFYFRSLGYRIVSGPEARATAKIRITRFEQHHDPFEGPTLLVDTVHPSIRIPLGKAIQRDVGSALRLDFMEADGRPQAFPDERFEPIDPPAPFVLVNPFVDSGWFRIRRRHRELLLARSVIHGKDKGANTILCGSRRDLSGLGFPPPPSIMDRRGEWTIPQLVSAIGSERCVGVFCFDTFVAHVALLSGKSTFVLAKPRFSSKQKAFVENCVLPFWDGSVGEPGPVWIHPNG